MIDLAVETVVSLNDAAKHLPRRRAGKVVHLGTLYRWIGHGVKGHKLECIRIGGSTCTSLEALQRFCDRLSGSDSTPPQITRGRKKEIARAESTLAEAGIT